MTQTGRWKIALALTGIFAAGAVAGGFGGYALSRKEDRPRISPDQYTERYLQRMIPEVKLTTEQVECLRPMMEEFSEKLSVMRHAAYTEAMKVVREMDKKIEADLNSEQRDLYRAMRDRDRAPWERRFGAKPEHEKQAKKKATEEGVPVPATGLEEKP